MFSRNDYKFNGDLSVDISRKKDTYFGRKIYDYFCPLTDKNTDTDINGAPRPNFARNVKQIKFNPEKTKSREMYIFDYSQEFKRFVTGYFCTNPEWYRLWVGMPNTIEQTDKTYFGKKEN